MIFTYDRQLCTSQKDHFRASCTKLFRDPLKALHLRRTACLDILVDQVHHIFLPVIRRQHQAALRRRKRLLKQSALYGPGCCHQARCADSPLQKISICLPDRMNDWYRNTFRQLFIKIIGRNAWNSNQIHSLLCQISSHPDHLRFGICLCMIKDKRSPVRNLRTTVDQHFYMLLIYMCLCHLRDHLHKKRSGHRTKSSDHS